MYTNFYHLKRKPFQISSDPAFIWLGEKHKEALATLKYGILDNKGFLLLTGDVGTGKTTLINTLLQSLSNDIISTTVPDPGLEKLDFFNFIAAGFGIEKEFLTKGTFLAHFRQFLIQAGEDKKKVLLIIDEAQLLTQEMLEEIRLLSNIEKKDTKLINIFFIGQNEFNEILNQNQNRAVRQRLTLNYNIDPLTPDETGEYIRHRLNIAGATYPIFNEEAIQEIFLNSGGFPRRINVICDHCLLSGYVKEKKTIDGPIVKECARELKIPASIKNRDINGFSGDCPEVHSFEPAAGLWLPKPHEVAGEKTNKPYITSFFIFLILGFLILFFSFSDYFNHSTGTIYKNIQKYKQILFHPPSDRSASPPEEIEGRPTDNGRINPEPPFSETTQQDDKIELPLSQNEIQMEETASKDQDLVEKTVNLTAPVEKTHPIAELHSKAEPDPSDILTKTDSGLKHDKDKKIPPLPTEKVVVRFKYDNNDFTEEGLNKLVDFADILTLHPDANIIITGYTDSEGYENYNQKLSEFRANIVRSFFFGRGIKPDQVELIGAGSKNPVESNETTWGRGMNRRVEIEVKKK
jgi:general secretion pathway protein A